MNRLSLFFFLFAIPLAFATSERPNVILIFTDDQGFGDVGFHGNAELKTPHLGRLASESAEFIHFYVQPLCSPTRAALLTGRYPQRTGIVEVNFGRNVIRESEITVAEILKASGYCTGIFDKWHLGSNFPIPLSDKLLEEFHRHLGGVIGQAGNPPGNNFFGPILRHNNLPNNS